MIRKYSPAPDTVTIAEVTLNDEQDVVVLCRHTRQAGERLGLPSPAVQRLCAASFEVGQQIQVLAPGSRASLLLGPQGALDTLYLIDDADGLGQPARIQALLAPVASVVSRVAAGEHAGAIAVALGIDGAGAATAADPADPHPILDRLAALGVPDVALHSRSLLDGLVNLSPDLDGAARAATHGVVSLYAELAETAGQLRLAEQRLRLLLDSVHDYAICLLTTDGQVSSTNVGAERLFDCPADEMVGRGFEGFYLPEDRDAGVPAAQLVGAERDGRFETASLRLRRGPGTFDAHVVVAPVRDADHLLRGFSFVVRDITDRRQLEDDLRRRAEDLAAANRAKEEFLATLSHELRTPLNAMLGWTRLLRMGKLDAAGVERALETIERNAHIQEQLIGDILDVSRIVTGKLRVTLRPVDLAPVVDATLDAVRPTAGAKGVELRAHLVVAGPVHGDPDRLQQVFWNLLANAIKFTPAGGRVTLDLVQEGEMVVVRVTDTGQGIDAELLPFIFDRFRQGDVSATRPHGGIGLGLAIVRHIVELHGGHVVVHSAGSGQGTTFAVSLPMRPHIRPPRRAAAAD